MAERLSILLRRGVPAVDAGVRDEEEGWPSFSCEVPGLWSSKSPDKTLGIFFGEAKDRRVSWGGVLGGVGVNGRSDTPDLSSDFLSLLPLARGPSLIDTTPFPAEGGMC